MAVSKKNSFQIFFGTTAEKAAYTSVLLGDKYFETDTGLMFVWTGADWVADAEDVLTLAAGTALIGKVGIDQTTPETTNKVTVEGITSSVYSSADVVASGVIKASAGKLLGISGINNAATAQYIQIFNAATVPADGNVPLAVYTVPNGSNFSLDFGMFGLTCAAGICWSNSSTLATKTIGAADCWVTATYI